MSAVRHDDVHAFADGELPAAEAEAFRAHLADCARCRAELEDLLQLQALGHAARAPVASVTPLRPPAPAPRARTPWRAAGVALALAASVAAVLLAGRALRGGADAPVQLARADARTLEARFAYAGAAAHRPYQVVRGAGAGDAVALQQLAELERRGDAHGLGVGHALRGEWGPARAHLERAGGGPDVLADRGAVALAQGELEPALELLDAALEARPAHAVALFDRALALRELGLTRSAAQAFRDVERQGEPGWAAEAGQRAAALEAEAQAAAGEVQAAWAALHAMARGGPPVSVETARSALGHAHNFTYLAVLTAPDAARLAALRPLALALDGEGGPLVRTLDATARRAAARPGRAALAAELATLLDGRFDRAARADAFLAALRRAGEPHLEAAALALLGRAEADAEAYARAARATADPFFVLNARRLQALADVARGDTARGELRLREALAECTASGAPGVAFRCLQLRMELAMHLWHQHRLPEAAAEARVALEAARRLREPQWEDMGLQVLGDVARFRNAAALARAYLGERALRNPDCQVQRGLHHGLASLHVLALRPAAAREELARADACEAAPTLQGVLVRADLARLAPQPDDVARVREELAALRAGPAFSAGERALADHMEGLALLPTDATAARVLLRRAITAAAPLAADDANAHKARAYSYSALLLEAGTRGAWAEALALFAEEQGQPAPAACALGVELHLDRLLVVARGPDGTAHGALEAGRASPAFEPAALVPPALRTALAGCAQVGVLARHPVHGRAGLLPPDVAWSYVRGAPAPPRAPGGLGPRLVVRDVEPPAALGLPRLAGWAQAEEAADVTLRGAQATPARVLEALGRAGEAEVHAHGLVNLGASDASFVALSPDADGRYALTAREVRAARLPGAPLVVLAACRAAAGAPYMHEPWGLPLAFLQAGARGVIASTADVPDAHAGPFFQRLRARLAQGHPPAVALRDERLASRGQPWEAWAQSVLVFE